MTDPELVYDVNILCSLCALTDNEREAIVDHHWLGLAKRDIAAQRGVSIQAVSQIIDRAHAKMATKLEVAA